MYNISDRRKEHTSPIRSSSTAGRGGAAIVGHGLLCLRFRSVKRILCSSTVVLALLIFRGEPQEPSSHPSYSHHQAQKGMRSSQWHSV